MGFAISLVIGMIYYVCLFVANLARNRMDLHPELLIWIPNVIFLTIGAYRFRVLAQR